MNRNETGTVVAFDRDPRQQAMLTTRETASREFLRC